MAERVAALYDIHGNLPALDAVLQEVREAGVDSVVVGGDVFPGPMDVEALDRLSALGIPIHCLHGNGERIVLAGADGKDISEVPVPVQGIIHWSAARLTTDQRRWLAGWPPLLRLDIRGIGQVLFCHATTRNDSEIFTRLTPEDRLEPVFGALDVPVVVCGHTHMQFDRTIGRVRIVNAGSVGMPFAAPQGAYWLLLGPDVQLRRTTYDFEAAVGAIRQTGFPLVEGMAVKYVLDPPTEAETLAMYAGTDLK